MFDFFNADNLSKRESMGSSFQNLYFSLNGFITIFGLAESMSSIDDSSTEVNVGQTSPSSDPSIVGSL